MVMINNFAKSTCWQHYMVAFVRVDLILIDLASVFGDVIMNNYYYIILFHQ